MAPTDCKELGLLLGTCDFPGGSDGKVSAYNAETRIYNGRPGFNPWVGKISWRRKWQPTPVFLPGRSHGWRSLVGYSPWGLKESDTILYVYAGLPRWCIGKESACQCRRHKRCSFDPWVGKIPWSRKWQPTSGFLPAKFRRQRSLASYRSWGCKKSNMTE